MEQRIELRIENEAGLHARPAAELVRLTGNFDADVWLAKDGVEVNAKSIMGVLMLAAERGAVITLRARGDDAEAVVAAVRDLVEKGFGER